MDRQENKARLQAALERATEKWRKARAEAMQPCTFEQGCARRAAVEKAAKAMRTAQLRYEAAAAEAAWWGD
ncbi:MAG: hypothetical protein IKZ87_04655 [Actinomycetaceae bacterium]|nr:hypothetical protein [Actinomycetaceae bacterium]